MKIHFYGKNYDIFLVSALLSFVFYYLLFVDCRFVNWFLVSTRFANVIYVHNFSKHMNQITTGYNVYVFLFYLLELSFVTITKM